MNREAATQRSSPLKRLRLVFALAILAAVGVRMFFLRRGSSRPVPAAAAMDDSTAELPLTPPSLPPDNTAGLRDAHARLDTVAPSDALPQVEQAAQTALDVGDLWQAETLARGILRRAPTDRSARLTLADSLRRQARFDKARALYLQFIQKDSRDSDAYIGLADTAFDANRRPEAFDWLARGVTQGAQTATALTVFAHRYQDWKDYPRAEQTAARALGITPDDPNALLQLASIQVEGNKLEAGRQTLETLLRKDPNNGLAHRLLAVTLMNGAYAHQDITRARSLLEKAVELNPKDAEIYRSAAVIYRQQRLYRLAAQAYDALLHLDPTSLDGRYGLGQVYALLGKNDLSRQQLAIYKLLEAQERQVTRLTEDVVHHPTQAQAHAALAQCLQARGDYARAVTQYQIAAGLAPHDATVGAAINRIYARLGWRKPEHQAQ